MKQEIRAVLLLTLGGDVAQPIGAIREFLMKAVADIRGTEHFSVLECGAVHIREESEIYETEREMDGVWEFVETYYPNYPKCGEIMRNDDLLKLLHGELCGEAADMFREEFGEDRSRVAAEFERSTRRIYEKAIVGYQKAQQGTIAIVWGAADVEERAKANGYELKEGEAQRVVELLKERHDCNIGVSWDVIDSYISAIVPDSDHDDGLVWYPLKYHGREYLCRLVMDGETELLVAPIALSEAIYVGDVGKIAKDAEPLDEMVTFYATPEEMGYGDGKLLALIYGG